MQVCVSSLVWAPCQMAADCSTAELWLALHAGVTSSDTYHSHQHMRTDLQSMGVANVLAQAEGADGMATAAGG